MGKGDNSDNGVRVGGSDDRVNGDVVIVGGTDDLGNGEEMVRCCCKEVCSIRVTVPA